MLVQAGHDRLNVGELQRLLDHPASTLAHHLGKLTQVGLVVQTRHGLAGTVSSIPAAIAVFALARLPVFLAYLGFAFPGAVTAGLLFGLV